MYLYGVHLITNFTKCKIEVLLIHKMDKICVHVMNLKTSYIFLIEVHSVKCAFTLSGCDIRIDACIHGKVGILNILLYIFIALYMGNSEIYLSKLMIRCE